MAYPPPGPGYGYPPTGGAVSLFVSFNISVKGENLLFLL